VIQAGYPSSRELSALGSTNGGNYTMPHIKSQIKLYQEK